MTYLSLTRPSHWIRLLVVLTAFFMALIGTFSPGPAQARRDAMDVGVDWEYSRTARVHQHALRDLVRDTWQGSQVRVGIWRRKFSESIQAACPEFAHDHPECGVYLAGLDVRQPCRAE